MWAQVPTESGQITGLVKDPAQAVISGAQVTLTNQQTRAKTTAVSDGQGVYRFTSVQPGGYIVSTDVKGFKPIVSPELKVVPGQTVNFDFALLLAGATDTLNVTAASV